LFICPSHVLQRTFIRPFAEVRPIQDFTRGKKTLDVRGWLSGP
jgi:hypothetical protein